MRYPIGVVIVIATVLAACSGGAGDLGETTTTVGAPTTSADPSGNGSRVQGEVTTPEEAFCVGLVFMTPSSPGVLVPEMEPLRQATYETCMAERLGEDAPPDMSVATAFVIGCAFVATQFESAQAMPEDARFDIATALCRAFIDRTNPDNLGLEARITQDGVCYIGARPEDGMQPCE